MNTSFLLCAVYHIWNHIYSNNPTIKPTQSYQYYKHLFVSFYLHKKILSRWKVIFHHYSKDGNDCILPLVVNKKRRTIRSISYYGRLDYEDIISSTNNPIYIGEALQNILQPYPGYSITFENINEDSLLFPVLKKSLHISETCVKIELPDNYNAYFEKLSKHQRQNIRTAYNKLSKEDFATHLVQYDTSHHVPRKVWHQCKLLYDQRHNASGSKFKLWYERETNPFHRILNNVQEHRIMVLFHNETPIAYMAGLFSQSQSCYYIPRLCINNEYSKYSPGILLVNETIKQLINEGVKTLDLMRGDEPYKFAMGGTANNNYALNCNVNDLILQCNQ